MRVKLQLVLCSDEGQEETVTDVITLNKNHQRIEHPGLTLAEAKQLLSTSSDTCNNKLNVSRSVFHMPGLWALLKVKAHASRSFRTLFGTYQTLPARGWSTVTAHGARPRHSAPYPRCSPSRSPLSCCIWKRSGPPSSPTA